MLECMGSLRAMPFSDANDGGIKLSRVITILFVFPYVHAIPLSWLRMIVMINWLWIAKEIHQQFYVLSQQIDLSLLNDIDWPMLHTFIACVGFILSM